MFEGGREFFSDFRGYPRVCCLRCDSSSCTPCFCHMPSMRRTAVTQCASRTRKRRAPVSRRRLGGGAKSAKKQSKDAAKARKLSSHEKTFLKGLPTVPQCAGGMAALGNAGWGYNRILKKAYDALHAHDFDKSISGCLTSGTWSRKAYTPLEVFIQVEKLFAKLNPKGIYGVGMLTTAKNRQRYRDAVQFFNYVNDSKWNGLRTKHTIQGCKRMKSPPWDLTV